MRIRDEMLRVFADHQDRAFEQRVVDAMQRDFPEAAEMDGAELLYAVRTQVRNASKYGLIIEGDVASYAVSAFLLGEDFDVKFPAAQQRLRSPSYTAEEKSDWLRRWTSELFRVLLETPER